MPVLNKDKIKAGITLTTSAIPVTHVQFTRAKPYDEMLIKMKETLIKMRSFKPTKH